MRTSLRRDLTAALKDRNRTAIDDAEALPAAHPRGGVAEHEHIAGSAVGLGAAEVERRHLTEADMQAIVEKEVHERSATAVEYEQLGRKEYAERLRSEADVLKRYLRPAR